MRVIALIMGCMYGPFLFLVLPLGGLYLAADVLLLYTVFKGQSSDKGNLQNGTLYHEVYLKWLEVNFNVKYTSVFFVWGCWFAWK